MRTYIFLLAATGFFACKQEDSNAISAEKPPFDEGKELAAIIRTIEGETASFYARDYEEWKKYFIHKDYAFQGWNSSDGSFDASVGWQDVDRRIGEYIRNNPVKSGETTHAKVDRKNMVIHFFSENVAYLVWDQYNSDKDMKTFTFSKDQRIMEKENGEWKIVNVTSFWNYKNKLSADSINGMNSNK